MTEDGNLKRMLSIAHARWLKDGACQAIVKSFVFVTWYNDIDTFIFI